MSPTAYYWEAIKGRTRVAFPRWSVHPRNSPTPRQRFFGSSGSSRSWHLLVEGSFRSRWVSYQSHTSCCFLRWLLQHSSTTSSSIPRSTEPGTARLCASGAERSSTPKAARNQLNSCDVKPRRILLRRALSDILYLVTKQPAGFQTLDPLYDTRRNPTGGQNSQDESFMDARDMSGRTSILDT